jgi:hypothetical protein
VVRNKVDKFGAGFFSADKAQNVAVPVVQRGFATQSDEKKTSQMSNLFRNASLRGQEAANHDDFDQRKQQ